MSIRSSQAVLLSFAIVFLGFALFACDGNTSHREPKPSAKPQSTPSESTQQAATPERESHPSQHSKTPPPPRALPSDFVGHKEIPITIQIPKRIAERLESSEGGLTARAVLSGLWDVAMLTVLADPAPTSASQMYALYDWLTKGSKGDEVVSLTLGIIQIGDQIRGVRVIPENFSEDFASGAFITRRTELIRVPIAIMPEEGVRSFFERVGVKLIFRESPDADRGPAVVGVFPTTEHESGPWAATGKVGLTATGFVGYSGADGKAQAEAFLTFRYEPKNPVAVTSYVGNLAEFRLAERAGGVKPIGSLELYVLLDIPPGHTQSFMAIELSLFSKEAADEEFAIPLPQSECVRILHAVDRNHHEHRS